MYPFLLSLHNIFRWVVLAAALWAVFRFLSGWLGHRAFTEGDAKARKLYPMLLGIQFLIGLIVYFLSPLVGMMFDNFKGAMAIDDIRFFGMEHAIVMLVATALAHIGAGVSRKAADDAAKFRKGAIFFVLSLAAMLFAIPWWRPMFRMTFSE